MSPVTIYILITVTISITYIFHLDAPNQIASEIARWITKGKITRIELRKPLGCPNCTVFWCNFGLLIFLDPTYIWVSLVCCFAVRYIDYAISTIELLLDKIFLLLDKLINKI